MRSSSRLLWRTTLPLFRPAGGICYWNETAPLSKCPEVEGQLKLLYTAVTRCIERLFFAETSSCAAGLLYSVVTTKRGPMNQSVAVKQNVVWRRWCARQTRAIDGLTMR
jgi:hypothetical protein